MRRGRQGMRVGEIENGDLVLVRFSPFSATRLVEQAEDEFTARSADGRAPLYAVSMFGDIKTRDEEVDELVERIIETASLHGKSVAVVTERDLEGDFEIAPSAPPPLHYDVILTTPTPEPAAEKLAELLSENRRRNPLWRK